MTIKIGQEISQALEEIKQKLSGNTLLTNKELEILFLASLLEEES